MRAASVRSTRSWPPALEPSQTLRIDRRFEVLPPHRLAPLANHVRDDGDRVRGLIVNELRHVELDARPLGNHQQVFEEREHCERVS